MKRMIYISSFATSCLLVVGCGGVTDSFTSPWSYEKKVNAVTKSVIHESIASLSPEGSSTGESTVVVTLLCEKENDPASLFLEVATFDGKDTSADSALEMGGDINLRFNGAVVGPVKPEGTDFINMSKWSVAALNYVSLFDFVKNMNVKKYETLFGERGVRDVVMDSAVYKIKVFTMINNRDAPNQGLIGFLRSTFEEISKLIGPYQHRIWDDEFVFSAPTSAGNLSVSVSLSDPAVKKTVEACGFTYGTAPGTVEGQKVPSGDKTGGNVADPADEAAPAENAAQAPLSQGAEESSVAYEDSPEFMEAVESCREAQVQQLEEESGAAADSDEINAISERCILKFKDANNQ
jgi:hypothetical protein